MCYFPYQYTFSAYETNKLLVFQQAYQNPIMGSKNLDFKWSPLFFLL